MSPRCPLHPGNITRWRQTSHGPQCLMCLQHEEESSVMPETVGPAWSSLDIPEPSPADEVFGTVDLPDEPAVPDFADSDVFGGGDTGGGGASGDI